MRSPHGIQTTYRNILFRSRLEATWAAFFDQLRWEWQYEPFDCDGWIPDFSLKSVMNAPAPVLVEVKPITDFCQDTADKIDCANSAHEVLLLGIAPDFESHQPHNARLGWLRDAGPERRGDGVWDDAILGLWSYDQITNRRNPSKLIGFCHAGQSYEDRITGLYDGSWGDGSLYVDDLKPLWAQAKNAVRWRP